MLQLSKRSCNITNFKTLKMEPPHRFEAQLLYRAASNWLKFPPFTVSNSSPNSRHECSYDGDENETSDGDDERIRILNNDSNVSASAPYHQVIV